MTTEELEKLAFEARMPLARDLYNARHAIARLLITYRRQLQGTWYEDTARDAGLELDTIGFIKNCRESLDSPGPFGERARREVAELAKIKK